MKQDDFKLYVEKAMANSEMVAMKPVVEKELLHYEIFNALDEDGLLKNLVFQGGTSLRLCRGSERFSEDLDFAGGRDFSSQSMEKIKECIVKHIGERFGLRVTVKNPKPVK
jgi:predicted nucleotidyltransferase component of viral defense system